MTANMLAEIKTALDAYDETKVKAEENKVIYGNTVTVPSGFDIPVGLARYNLYSLLSPDYLRALLAVVEDVVILAEHPAMRHMLKIIGVTSQEIAHNMTAEEQTQMDTYAAAAKRLRDNLKALE